MFAVMREGAVERGVGSDSCLRVVASGLSSSVAHAPGRRFAAPNPHLKTTARKTGELVGPPPRAAVGQTQAFPLRQVEMRICYEAPVDKMLRAVYSALTIANHCSRRVARRNLLIRDAKPVAGESPPCHRLTYPKASRASSNGPSRSFTIG